eukprot:COSAG04_NODE_10035_length_811_cov_1.369382_1_plen_109_part_10
MLPLIARPAGIAARGMPPVVVHQQPHETRHLAPRCSCAYLCSWFALVVAILVPYFVAFHTSEPARPSTVRRLSIVARLIAAPRRQLLGEGEGVAAAAHRAVQAHRAGDG